MTRRTDLSQFRVNLPKQDFESREQRNDVILILVATNNDGGGDFKAIFCERWMNRLTGVVNSVVLNASIRDADRGMENTHDFLAAAGTGLP